MKPNTLAPPSSATTPYAQEDSFADIFYRPHTISMAVLAFAVVAYIGFVREHEDFASDLKWGLFAVYVMFMAFCTTHLPDSHLIRPHPAFWRFVTGNAIVYFCVLIFFFTQPIPIVRQILGFFDDSLMEPLPERSYADACDFYTPDHPTSKFANFFGSLDEFIFAHVLGHMGKGIIIRDWRVCLALSVSFELIEITFQHILENFAECWWDHYILDIAVCNLGGMLLGLWICDYLKCKKYDWISLKNIKTYKGKLGRIAQQFSPFEWTPYQWGTFKSFPKYASVVFVIFIMSLVETNAFFLKSVLWLPPPHKWNSIRLIMWWLMGISGFREFYQYCNDKECRRLGLSAWVCLAVCTSECLLVVKFALEMGLYKPFPTYIKYPWMAMVGMQCLWCALYFPLRKRLGKGGLFNFLLEMLFYLSFAPGVFMLIAGCPDTQLGRRWYEDSLASIGITE